MKDILKLIRDVVNSADDNGSNDLLVPKSAFEALADYVKQQEYVANRGEICPHCGGYMDVVVDPVLGDSGTVWQKSKCFNCNKIVDETYYLVGFSNV